MPNYTFIVLRKHTDALTHTQTHLPSHKHMHKHMVTLKSI